MPTKSISDKIKEFFHSNEKAFKVILISLLIISFLILVSVAFNSLKRAGQQTQAPEPTPTPPAIPERPSAYADDPEVLASESEINEIEKLLKDTNLNESILLPPKIDLKIDIEE